MRCIKPILLALCAVLYWDASAFADGTLTPAASTAAGLPAAGSVNDCILNTAPGTGTWQACPGAAGGDSVSVNGVAVADPNFTSTASDLTLTDTANVITFTLKSGLTITSPTLVTPALGTPASGVMTNVTGTAASLTAGTASVANTGDSATAFFSAGTIEDARLPSSMASKSITTSLNIPNSTSLPGTCTVGDQYMDTDAATGQRHYLCESTNTWAVQGAGAPSDATYITQTAHANLSAEQALGSLGTGCMASATTTGVVATRTITGTANEITVTNGDCSGAPTLSLPATIDLGGKTSFEVPNAAAPTTDAFGEIAGDNDAWAASRGAVQFYDGTANTFLLGTLASDVPGNGECPKWNTGGTITWESCAAGGSVATDTIFDIAGDLVYANGSNSAVKLPIGTANQLLQTNAGATAPAWTSTVTGLTSIDFGSNPADAGRLRLANNEQICWELNTPGVDKCLHLNASDEFEMNAPLNLTGTAGALLQTGVVSPSAPGTAEQWYFYADSVDNLPKYIYNAESEQTFYTTANPQTTITGNAGTATALAANPADCAANEFATTIAASGALTCAAIVDADVPNTITASNYLPLAGGTMTGSLITDNLGIEFEDSDVNPTCAAGEYKLYADLSETKFKKCMNGIATDLDTTGGTPDFGTITGGTNTTAAMVVGTGGSLAVSGSGTIAATTAAALAANGGNCSAGSYPLGVGADGAVESCTAVAGSDIGAATATTPAANDNDTSVATTAYVQTELTAYAADSVTFTNKTLTSPIISSISNTGTVTLFTASDTVVGKATTDTLTNKTLDAEGTGNVLTIPRRLWFPAAGCNNVTAGSIWDLPTANAPEALCKTGTNTQKGVLAFDATTDESAQVHYLLPSTWTGTVDARIFWYSATITSAVAWCVQLVSTASAETDDPAFPAQATGNCVSSAAAGTTLQMNIATITGATITGVAASELLHILISRDPNETSTRTDTSATDAFLVGVELTIREAL